MKLQISTRVCSTTSEICVAAQGGRNKKQNSISTLQLSYLQNETMEIYKHTLFSSH